MPKKKRPEPLYRRGEFRLDWDRRRDGSLRSPFLTVFWYDQSRGGERSQSTRTAELEEAKAKLDKIYLERSTGQSVCPTCLRPWDKHQGYLLTAAIADYQDGTVPGKSSEEAIRARLSHVFDYLEAKQLMGVTCEEIDELWIERFRTWSAKQPIRSPKGKIIRDRALSTTEASVAQLSAAINDANRRRNARYPAAFKVRQDTNQTPQHRSDVAEIAAMFRYCVTPDVSGELARGSFGRGKGMPTKEELIEIRRRERASLHRFLIISIATLARPDAAYDVSPIRRGANGTARRRSWRSIQPAGVRRRSIARRCRSRGRSRHGSTGSAEWLARVVRAAKKEAQAGAGRAILRRREVDPEGLEPHGGRSACRRARGRREADPPLDGKLLRDRLPKADWPEITLFMGHDDFDQTTTSMRRSIRISRAAKAEIERIIDEIEGLCPGAFSRTIAGAARTSFRSGRG
jgi:hypothetical protein